MKNKIIISTIIAMSLAAGGSAFAQSWDHNNGHDSHDQHRGASHVNHAPVHANQRHSQRGAGPHHEFHRGGRISSEYRGRQYVVNDWRGHHLHQPPRGYQWVQTGPDFVLIAATTGIIAQIVLSN